MIMTNQEVGCYIKLLCFSWKQGSIPNDINKIAKLCGENSIAMADLWENIKSCFVVGDSIDRLINKRIEKERKKQQEYRRNRSESGKIGANKRWNKHIKNGTPNGYAMTQPMAKNSSSSSSSSLNKKLYSPNSDELRLSSLLLDLILSRRNSFKKPDLQKWAVHIGRMIRIDKRAVEEIEKIIRWSQQDNFWQNNILSTEKLRRQYDQLALKALKPESQWLN